MSRKQTENSDQQNPGAVDNARRDFLRNSVYAAYATPLITALLVAEESAAASNCTREWCDGLPPTAKPKCCNRFW